MRIPRGVYKTLTVMETKFLLDPAFKMAYTWRHPMTDMEAKARETFTEMGFEEECSPGEFSTILRALTEAHREGRASIKIKDLYGDGLAEGLKLGKKVGMEEAAKYIEGYACDICSEEVESAIAVMVAAIREKINE